MVEHLRLAREAFAQGVSALAFPELSLTGYTCGDLFFREDFLDVARCALLDLAAQTSDLPLVLVVGLPVFNTAVVLSGGRLRGAVPKTYLPTISGFPSSCAKIFGCRYRSVRAWLARDWIVFSIFPPVRSSLASLLHAHFRSRRVRIGECRATACAKCNHGETP